MRRREAIRVFREIYECIPDMFLSSVSLTPLNGFKGEFELRIFASFDVKGFESVQSVVQKHGMSASQDQGFLLISDAANQVEIAV